MPILKDAKSKGQRAHIAVDKLYIEGNYTRTRSIIRAVPIIVLRAPQIHLGLLKRREVFHSQGRSGFQRIAKRGRSIGPL